MSPLWLAILLASQQDFPESAGSQQEGYNCSKYTLSNVLKVVLKPCIQIGFLATHLHPDLEIDVWCLA